MAYNAALDYFSTKDEDTNWIIPVVVNISNELRLIAGLVSFKSMLFIVSKIVIPAWLVSNSYYL